ncbi:hypothetical protein CROQUDRAFT_54507 [Cronartium quercuum f. sp. fusiforme G11]|uniref:[histone H3]-trimethyl-L-lysine(4) demethylase n=1 Tax=Cronartium quercuum f. sp. fusiforme G11 TaxID=708437 RepID=A0A9P6N5E6_9BASI|nr:hypothetical protein CROQUDRAFT_54507 [Cronartium quercuum f. sp. fusiforme G11]
MLSIKSIKQTNNNNKSRKSEPGPSRNPNRSNLNLNQKSERKLDINSIRLIAPRISPKHDQNKRLFNLEHCPIFYPTIEEFKDPMKYFDSISSKLKSFGIGKIVPPIGWKSPCVLDTESFRFKTRLQRLNSMEASARANINFLDQLYIFHKQQGNSSFVNNSCKIQVPNIDYRPVDLWRVRKAVNALGGYDVITAQRKWSFLAKSLGYAVQRSPAIAFQLKTAYLKIIAPFEEYMNRVKLIQSPQRFKSPLDSLSPLTSPGPLSNNLNVTDESKPEISQNSDRQKINQTFGLPFITANPSTASLSAPSREWEESNDRGGEICEICGSDEDDPNILLCDCCDKGYHLQCLTPALQAVPEGNWFCDACILSTGNEFGFEEGQEYNLANFQLRADNFKKKWIEAHPIPIKKDLNGNNNNLELDDSDWSKEEFKKELELENHMEREFWRLVESPNENVEIEYGADIHSSTYGSGFPHVEKHPLEPYARDGWNLNNLPIAPGSLLRYIKSDIAGMTQPWIYVGMAFSTFAWHKEDHYTYSVNYHHWGDTKTWYGVPGEDDEKLEAAMKLAAPELFEQQPDVMYQLVTLMSPGRLKSAGVRTYVCDQRPNEFVITCPRSYHSGFNHGFNLNEAVNFCLPDWLPDGNLCVKHYKSLKKLPVFSHDELLITIFLNEKSPKVSRWLLPHFREMIKRELSDRENARTSISNLSTEVLIEPEDLPEDQIQCHHCKSLGYLSHVTSPGCPRVSCLEHSHTLGDGVKVLRFKYPDDVLEAMLLRVTNRSIKAGRQMDLTGIEQRTSGRKVIFFF